MFKKISIIMLLLMLIGIGTVHAGNNWYVYVYNAIQHDLLRVNAIDGSIETFDLGLADDTYVSGWTMGFSTDGSRVAYCVNTQSPEAAMQSSVVTIRNLATETDELQIDLGEVVGCWVGPNAFSADGGLLAISQVNYFPTDVNDTGNGQPIWQLLVVDTSTGEIVHELNSESPVVTEAGFPMEMPVMAEIREFQNDALSFVILPFGVGGMAFFDAYRWDLASGELEFLFNDPRSNGTLTDTLPVTGETVWLDYDPGLSAASIPAAGPMGQFNVVKMIDNSGSERIIYHTPDAVLGSPHFIAGGEQLSLMLYTQSDPDQPLQTSWITLDRQGNAVTHMAKGDMFEVVNAPGGLVKFEQRGDTETGAYSFALEYENFYDGENRTTELWSSDEMGWELVWSSPAPLGSNLTPFPSVQ